MNPAAILALMSSGLDLWQRGQQIAQHASAATVSNDPMGTVGAAFAAAQEYPQLYKAAAAFLAAHDRWAGKRKVPQEVLDARAELFRELSESFSALTGTPIPAEVKAQWGG